MPVAASPSIRHKVNRLKRPDIIPPEIVEQVRHASDIVERLSEVTCTAEEGRLEVMQGPSVLSRRKRRRRFTSIRPDADLQVLQQRAWRRCFQVSHAIDGECDLSRTHTAAGAKGRHRRPGKQQEFPAGSASQREELLAPNAAVAKVVAPVGLRAIRSRSRRAPIQRAAIFLESLADEFGLRLRAGQYFDATMKWACKKSGCCREALEIGKLIADECTGAAASTSSAGD